MLIEVYERRPFSEKHKQNISKAFIGKERSMDRFKKLEVI